MATIVDFAVYRTARWAGMAPPAQPVSVEPIAAPQETPPFEQPDPPQHWPAYCDPANELRGTQFDRHRSTPECAAAIRADIKAALKAGKLPAGLKVSVRSASFSGGSSIDMTVTAIPASFAVLNPERVLFDVDNPHACWTEAPDSHTEQAQALLDKLRRMAQAYNRDNSDSQSDYFDVHFYGPHPTFAHEIENEQRRAILEANGRELPAWLRKGR